MNDNAAKVICMATDAFRLCIGLPTKTFTPAQIVKFIRARQSAISGAGK